MRSCLKGEAAHIISSLESTEDNYSIAWDLLRKRYENKRIIIYNHVKSLYELPVVKQETATSLRRLLDDFWKNVRALKALGQGVDGFDIFLLYLVSTKLDSNSRLELEKTLQGKENPTIEDFSKFLNDKCQLLETINSDKTKVSKFTHNKFENRSLAHLASRKCQCSFCKGEHFNYKCSKLLALAPPERLNMAVKCKDCLNCLRPGHSITACKYRVCASCGQKHNILLHGDSMNNVTIDRPIQESLSEASTSAEVPAVLNNLYSRSVAFHCGYHYT